MSDVHILTTPITEHVVASDGVRLPMRAWLPSGPARRAVVALHGMVTHAGWFAQLGERLAARGVALLAPDRRGNGAARAIGPVGDAERLVADVHDVVRAARALADDVTLFSWCGSANFAVPAAVDAAVQRFVLASPGLVPLAAMSARFRGAEPIDGFLPIHFDPARDFTDDAAVAAVIAADPLYLRRIAVEVREAWKKLNPLARAALPRITVPTRCLLTRVDRMIDIEGTVALLDGVPIDWAEGGHGFLVEPAGADRVAAVLASEGG